MTSETSVEKPVNGHDYDLNSNLNHADAVHRIRTAGSISISPELFEKLYLSPQNVVKGDLRGTFANPTPLALAGFVVALSPLSIELMGWRGTGGAGVGAATIGAYFFYGGLLQILGSVGEWILGNTFPFVVFGTYGAFFLTFGVTLQPSFNAVNAYATDTADFYSSYGFFFLAMGLLSFLYLIASLRTNVTFVLIFFTLVGAFGCLAGAYWHLANGNTALAGKLQIAAGAFVFITSAAGWWIFFAILLATVDFPLTLPVGDLSTFIRGASERSPKTNGANKV